MNQKPMYFFVAGIFLLMLGYSFLHFQGETGRTVYPKLGAALSLLGSVLFIGALIYQLKRGLDNG